MQGKSHDPEQASKQQSIEDGTAYRMRKPIPCSISTRKKSLRREKVGRFGRGQLRLQMRLDSKRISADDVRSGQRVLHTPRLGNG